MPAASSPRDNRLVIAQEWIAEAMTMWFVSAIVAATTMDDCIRLSRLGLPCFRRHACRPGRPNGSDPGTRRDTFFKLCPVVLGLFALLLLVDNWVQRAIERTSVPLSERGGVDHEAVPDVTADDPVVGVVDLIAADDLDLGAQAMLSTEVQHLLRFSDAADRRTGEAPPVVHQSESPHRERSRRCADVRQSAVETEHRQVGVDRQRRRHGAHDEVEMFPELREGGIVGGGVVVGLRPFSCRPPASTGSGRALKPRLPSHGRS